jgi:PAS domain S-box-containing protein
MNKLLQRQIKRHLHEETPISDEMSRLFEDISSVYDHMGKDEESSVDSIGTPYKDLTAITASTLDIIFSMTKTGNLTFVSAASRDVLGYEPEEMVGTKFTKYIDRSDWAKCWKAMKDVFLHRKVRNLEIEAIDSSGRRVPVEVNGQLLKTKSGLVAQGSMRDISDRKKTESDLAGKMKELDQKLKELADQRRATLNILSDMEESRNQLKTVNIALSSEIGERRKAEENLLKSLAEKETLLKEVHHRVKNNLQVISSLLHLQSKKLGDPKTAGAFGDSVNRIKSMAAIHETLYRSMDIARVNFENYIESLAAILYESYGIGARRISINTNIDNIFFEIDTAVPVGLLVNELVSNALKHAFPKDRKGSITITLRRRDGNGYELMVSDDGVGLPSDFDLDKSTSLGIHLIHNLVKEQLRGTIETRGDMGTTFVITFQEAHYKRRI